MAVTKPVAKPVASLQKVRDVAEAIWNQYDLGELQFIVKDGEASIDLCKATGEPFMASVKTVLCDLLVSRLDFKYDVVLSRDSLSVTPILK